MDLINIQLKLSYWIITHKHYFKKGIIFLLITLNVFLWGISGYKWIYYIEETSRFRAAMKDMNKDLISWTFVHLKNKPRSLEVSDVFFIALGNSRYDFIAQINNSNARWSVPYLKYRFFWNGNRAEGSSFVLPAEKKTLLVFNIESEVAPKDLNLEILNIDWQRITPGQKLPDFSLSDFLVDKISSDQILKRVSFSVKNNSAYSFWTVYFKTILYQGKKIMAVNNISINKFFSGEERLMDIYFPKGIPDFIQAVIEPEVNIMDKNNFIAPKDIEGELK